MKYITQRITVILLFVWGLSSCQQADFTESKSMSQEEMVYEETESLGNKVSLSDDLQKKDSREPTVQGLHIIKTGNISLKVKDLEKAKQDALQVVKQNKGFASAANFSDNTYRKTQTLTIRVPSTNFESLMNGLGTVGYVQGQSENAQDVSEEFVDIEARLKTKREVEKRYTQLLQQANSISEVLEVEEKLRVIREEIEARQGRLRYLKDQISLSTIHLTLMQEVENYTRAPERSFFSRLLDNVEEGWDDFLSFVIVIMRLWVFWLVIGVSVWGIRKWLKSRKK